MTRRTKVNKRSVRKSTPVFEPETTAIETPKALLIGLSYRELQVMAKDHGFQASGSKVALIERLT